MLSEGWIGVIKHDFQLEGMNLTDILSADWEPYTEGLKSVPTALKRITTPKLLAKWLGFKTKIDLYDTDTEYRYITQLEFDHTSILEIEIPDDLIKYNSIKTYSSFFFHVTEEVVDRLEGHQEIETLWNHIKLELKSHFPKITKERKKHLKDMRKPTLVLVKEGSSDESPPSPDKNNEVE